MDSQIIIIAGGLIALAIVFRFLPMFLSRGASAALPYESKGNLLTPAERSFLVVLDEVVGTQYRIMGQVRLADVIKVRKGVDKKTWGTAFARIRSKHLDFVACDPNDLSIKFAVELDDSSHKRPDRQKRDAFLDQAMEAAQIPLHRFAVKRSYDPQEVRQAIFGQ
jgi:hypothetical protein